MASPFSRTTRSLVADTARRSLIAWSVAAGFLLVWLAWFFLSSVTVFEVSRKARLEVQQASHVLSPTLAGRVVVSHLAIGRAVRAGDTLVELDAASERLRLEEEEARLRAIPARIASLRNEIAAMEAVIAADQRSSQVAVEAAQARVREAGATVEFAQDNERRLSAESGSGSVAEIDALRAKAETRKQSSARDALSADTRKLDLDTKTRVHQNHAQIESLQRAVASLAGELGGARAAAARLALEIERHRIKAPVDGIVGEVMPLGAGAFVTEGQKLATIVPGGELIVVADFNPASALGRIHPGQAARLRLDGFPWAQYGSVDAVVARVSSEIRDNALHVELVPSARAHDALPMQHGLTGVVEISIERAAPATLLLRASGQRLASPAAQPSSAAEVGT